MINTLEIRSIPVNEGLFCGQALQCSAILHLFNNQQVPDEKIIDIIRLLISYGMDHLQIFGATSTLPLKIAYEENHMEVLNFLLSEEVVNHWNLPLDFMLFAKHLIQRNDFETLNKLLTSNLGTNAFNISLIQTKDKA